jgi:hypothetical protein
VQLSWSKCHGDRWCLLSAVDANQLPHNGVFVIWRNGNPSKPSSVLYVGHGSLRQELARCRRDPLFRGATGMHVTWAEVEESKTDAVAAYLYQQLRPIWGEVLPLVQAMPVNLPATA